MTRNAITNGFFAVLFAGIGCFQLASTTDNIVVENGSLPTISQMQAKADGHLDKEQGRLNKNDNPILGDKSNGSPLSKEDGLSADLF